MTPRSRKKTTLSVGFVSLGCAKNLVDSQVMAGQLLADGLVMVPPEEAQVVLINTCGFIEAAREETRATIRAYCELKKSGPCRAVFVTGCYAQRYRLRLPSEFPEVDGFVGLDALDRVGDLIRQWRDEGGAVWDVPPQVQRLYEPTLPGLRFAGGPYAYLKIAEGCHHRCRFCAIPLIRGDYRSRPIDALVRESEALVATGVREINLISQDCMAYGRDLTGSRKTNPLLPDLLRALDRIPGDFRIRILYGSIHKVGSELLRVMRESPRICHYLDLPVQHSHPEILQAMGRGATARDLPGTLRRLRAALPDLVLRTACIVGFPGESEAHFEHLLQFVNESRFDRLGAFVYSPEEGTPAARLPGRVAPQRAQERLARLLRTQRRIVARQADTLRKRRERILLEQPDTREAGLWYGRSYREAPAVDGRIQVRDVPDGARSGDWIVARYTGRKAYDRTARFESTETL